MESFFDTKAGKHASLSKQFLEGALTLDASQQEKGRILFVPTLALAGHGLELMLKACMLLNNEEPPTRGREGHSISDLWKRDVCEPVRGNVYAYANIAVLEHRENINYRGVPDENEDVIAIIEDHVLSLGDLHGGKLFPLRYPSDPDKKSPRTPLLVRALWGAADDFVKRPDEFRLAHFRGEP